jgi:hypothetical protein
VQDGIGADIVRLLFKLPHWTVPDDSLSRLNDLRKIRNRLSADIEPIRTIEIDREQHLIGEFDLLIHGLIGYLATNQDAVIIRLERFDKREFGLDFRSTDDGDSRMLRGELGFVEPVDLFEETLSSKSWQELRNDGD